MAKLDFIERDLIDHLMIASGYVLDFTNRTYREFILEKIQIDVYTRYQGLSKGKILRALLRDCDNITVGKLILELLRYMQSKNMIDDKNRETYKKCVEVGHRLIGKTAKSSTYQSETTQTTSNISFVDYDKYIKELQQLTEYQDTAQARGFAFEKYLKELFDAFGLQPRGSFKIVGEQIDGSFILKEEVYLLEAKWTSKSIDKSQLVVFNEKVSSKSGFSRGLFVSFSNFSDEAISTFAVGRTVNIVLMTVQDLAIALSRGMDIETVLCNKVRALAESGDFNKSIFEM